METTQVKGEFILKAITGLTHNDALDLINLYFPEKIQVNKWYSINKFYHLISSLENNSLSSAYDLGLSVIKNTDFNRTATNFVRGCILWNYINRQCHQDADSNSLNNYLDFTSFDTTFRKYEIRYTSPYSLEFTRGIISGLMLKYEYKLEDFKINISNKSISISFIKDKLQNQYTTNNSFIHQTV